MEEKPSFELHEPPAPEHLLPQPGMPLAWVLAGLAAALLVTILLLIVFRRRQKAADPNAARAEAFKKADRALAGAKPSGTREAATIASLVLRRYLAEAARDPALFETQEEFVARHGALASFSPEARESAATGFRKLAAMKYGSEQPVGEPAAVLTDARALLTTLDQAFKA